MTDIGRATEPRTDHVAGPSAASRSGTRAERRDRASADTRTLILEAARSCLLADGYANLSTRRVAEAADVPLSQIHYYFGSRQDLILAMLASENERLLARQSSMYAGDEPLWAAMGPRLRFPRGRPRVRLRPDPPGDDRGRLVRPGRGQRPRSVSWSPAGSHCYSERGPPRGGAHRAPRSVHGRRGRGPDGDALPRRRGGDPAGHPGNRPAGAFGSAQGRPSSCGASTTGEEIRHDRQPDRGLARARAAAGDGG